MTVGLLCSVEWTEISKHKACCNLKCIVVCNYYRFDEKYFIFYSAMNVSFDLSHHSSVAITTWSSSKKLSFLFGGNDDVLHMGNFWLYTNILSLCFAHLFKQHWGILMPLRKEFFTYQQPWSHKSTGICFLTSAQGPLVLQALFWPLLRKALDLNFNCCSMLYY